MQGHSDYFLDTFGRGKICAANFIDYIIISKYHPHNFSLPTTEGNEANTCTASFPPSVKEYSRVLATR